MAQQLEDVIDSCFRIVDDHAATHWYLRSGEPRLSFQKTGDPATLAELPAPLYHEPCFSGARMASDYKDIELQ